MRGDEKTEFIARAPEPGADRRFDTTVALRTFIRSLSEAAGTTPGVNAQTIDLAAAIALRVPARTGIARKPARTLAPATAVPDLVSVSCRLVSVDHRNRIRLRAALRGLPLSRHLDVLELGDGFAVLGVAAHGSDEVPGIRLRIDSQQRLLLSPGVALRLGIAHTTRQVLVAGDGASQQLALVHLGALLAKARNVDTARTAAP